MITVVGQLGDDLLGGQPGRLRALGDVEDALALMLRELVGRRATAPRSTIDAASLRSPSLFGASVNPNHSTSQRSTRAGTHGLVDELEHHVSLLDECVVALVLPHLLDSF